MDNAPSHVAGLIQHAHMPAARLAMTVHHAVNALRRAMYSVGIRDVHRNVLIHVHLALYLNVFRPAHIVYVQCLARHLATTSLARGDVRKP
ncbi:uncharacterized protein APUU_30246A [Aspergillus puulaauensis]|uniref:Uncharacterized protein n=1 Tax=Aspergillus puulaauensis TaxID=1220207 RepID=A0A7R7XIC8_9EURO|nr:uncharacterized protein APUU_30246A [Aspergillus puulaauensis]BCS22021.1 hypothetical protein APUU_30246A [Aspergillus puulaauensis]